MCNRDHTWPHTHFTYMPYVSSAALLTTILNDGLHRGCVVLTLNCAVCDHTHTHTHTHTFSHIHSCCLVLLVNGRLWWLNGKMQMTVCTSSHRHSASVCVGSSFVGDCSLVSCCFFTGHSDGSSYSILASLSEDWSESSEEWNECSQAYQ